MSKIRSGASYRPFEAVRKGDPETASIAIETDINVNAQDIDPHYARRCTQHSKHGRAPDREWRRRWPEQKRRDRHHECRRYKNDPSMIEMLDHGADSGKRNN
ncbi:hypothetical protein LRD18_11090 [Halorhodospira halochloris]|uniref:hypothetical protein n=1 Tax=Halorhodospira halochloris TaxID=1052 RepID=UPI001EE78F03|nr:hypothetical protein [Halorhodospira halochloris]MCG5531393.1 hypothetical protein [Halorhodospira halochloris]